MQIPPPLTFCSHEKISLKKHPVFNEAWLQDRIADDPSILGFGDVRLLDRERTLTGGGRLDLLLFDDENNRRYEVELMLGASDPSHIIRTIEYWDLERRRYPGYDHIAVLVAEEVTARFLNVLGLMAGSIPIIAVQLDALRVDDKILLNFVRVFDQSELRIDDDEEEDVGERQEDRGYWDRKVGPELMAVCDDVLGMINETASQRQEMNYLRRYIGLRSYGVVKNFIDFAPKGTKGIVHIDFRNDDAVAWKDRFEEAGVPVRSHRGRKFRVTVSPSEYREHRGLVQEAVVDTVKEFGV